MRILDKIERMRRDKERIERLRRRTSAPASDVYSDIYECMARLSPRLHRPGHFGKYIDYLHTAVGGGHRVVFSAPPQHGKTECTLHGLVWLAITHGDRRHAYVTYNDTRAKSVAKKVKRLLVRAGVQVTGTLSQLSLPGGGQILFTSIDGGITGEPVDGLAIIDDYVKNRTEADSARRREVVSEAYHEAIETRVHPGASIVVMATRWHPQDLSGELIDAGWESLNLPAFAEQGDPNGREAGDALFPAMWPVESLRAKKKNVLDFTWQALYQGHPRPRGGKVFHGATYYTTLPSRYKEAFGLDLAYTAKTSADWSVLLHLLREDRHDMEPLYYIVRVDRARCEAPEFADIIRRRTSQRPSARVLWRASGTEKGAAQFLVQSGIRISVKRPPGDKLVSATAAAAAWNDGRVLVPSLDSFPDAATWLEPFLDIVGDFSGSGKEHDDDVDALGSAMAAIDAIPSGTVFSRRKDRGLRLAIG